MIKLDLKNALGIKKTDFTENRHLVLPYIKRIHSRRQGFYTALDETSLIKEIEDFAKAARKKYKHFVILGIGGSALGAKAIKKAFVSPFETQKLHILDNIDPTFIRDFEKSVDYKKTLFLVITKSGTTPETISQYLYFRQKIKSKNLPIKNHFVFITNAKKGYLREVAQKEKIQSFEIPSNVCGRFSVLTAAGLAPAALMGVNIKKLVAGAKKMRERFLNKEINSNPAFKLALVQYLLWKRGKSIHVLMPYSQKLTGFLYWFKQLYAESLGKKEKGITPLMALGVSDQHAQIQLFNEGPLDKLVMFVEVENSGEKIEIPNFPAKKHLSFNQLFEVEKESTKKALTKYLRPNLSIILNKMDEENFGELIMLFEGTVSFLGEFFNINAFNQPGVDLGKKLTKQAILKL